MITLICLWGRREGKAAKRAPSMLTAVLTRQSNIADHACTLSATARDTHLACQCGLGAAMTPPGQ